MCELCDGATLDEVLDGLHRCVQTHGFSIQLVEVSPGWGWGYTIGLVDEWDHDELIVVHRPLDEVGLVLSELAAEVRLGERFEAGEVAGVLSAEVAVNDVHPAHYARNLFNVWWTYYASLDRRELELRALQVVTGDVRYCYEHQTTQPDLSSPAALPEEGNRAARRRAELDHRRARRRIR